MELTKNEKAVLDVLSTDKKIHIAEIRERTDLPAYDISYALFRLELKNLASQSAGKLFCKK